MSDLTTQNRNSLATRQSPADMAAVVAEISVTLATMPRQSTAAADAGDIVKIYASDLLSEFAPIEIVSALKDFRLGRCGGKFAPTIGEIASHIRSEREIGRIAKLPAPEEPPKRYRIDRESKWGRAWDYYARREGVKLMWIGGSAGLMTSLWPPGCNEAVAADWEREWASMRISDGKHAEMMRIIGRSGKQSAAE